MKQFEDSIYVHTSHIDTTINEQHVIIDTFKNADTVYVETHVYDKEIEIIEKLIDRPDFGKNAVSILIVVFVAYTLIKKWKANDKKLKK